MLEVYDCEQCNTKIKIKVMRGFTHICCENCGSQYELTQKSLRYYWVLPLLSVTITVLLSINFLITNDIFIKAVFILTVSYFLFIVFGMWLVKFNFIEYEKKE